MNDRVRDWMSGEVLTIRRDGDLATLEKLLVERKVHGVPVVDENDRIVGVASQTDLLAWHARGGSTRGPGTGRVAEIMSPLIHCIGPGRPVAEAAGRMVREGIHRLVVVDENYLVLGVLSAIDVLRAVPGIEYRRAESA